MTGGEEHAAGEIRGDELRLTPVERSHVDSVRMRAPGRAPVLEVEEMPAVGEERRPAVRLAGLRIDGRGLLRGSASVRDAEKGAAVIGSEHDRAGSVPASTPTRGRVAQDLDRATARVHDLEPPVGEEAEPASVRRPEGRLAVERLLELLRRPAASSDRTQRLLWPSGPMPTNARRVPSGERAKLNGANDTPGGGRIDVRCVGPASGARPRPITRTASRADHRRRPPGPQREDRATAAPPARLLRPPPPRSRSGPRARSRHPGRTGSAPPAPSRGTAARCGRATAGAGDRPSRSAAGSACRMAASVSAGVAPTKGRRPPSIS